MKINLKKTAARIGLMAFLVGGGLLLNEGALRGTGESFVTSADARVGRPATPMSYAGVARRTTRRAVIATTPVYVAPVVVAPARTCVQAVDAYGRIYTRCY